MRRRAIGYHQHFTLQLFASLGDEDSKALFVQTRHQHRKQLARKRLERHIQIAILVTDFLFPYRARPLWHPPFAQLGARSDAHLVLKLNLLSSKLFGQLAKVFLYAATCASSLRSLEGRAVFNLIRIRRQKRLSPPRV